MTKREFLDIVFALAPNEANKIMDAFDEYVESNEPHWIPVTERLPDISKSVLICDIEDDIYLGHRTRYGDYYPDFWDGELRTLWHGANCQSRGKER